MERKYVTIEGKKVPLGMKRLGNWDETKYHPLVTLCPVCGKYAFAEAENFDVCPFCGWENDGSEEDPDLPCGPNPVNITKARENYKKIGAIHESRVAIVKALTEQFEKGVTVPNATMYAHITEYVEDADPVKMIKKQN